MKIRVAILFGGQSGEHEVSIQSAQSIFVALDRTKYEPILVGVDKQGVWHLGEDGSFILNAADPKGIALDTSAPTVIPWKGSGHSLVLRNPETGENLRTVDVVFPIMHGPLGEDGSLQGLLQLLQMPCVGAGVLGSAVGMDKDVMKRLFREAGLPTAQCRVVRRHQLDAFDAEKAAADLGLPLFVKPCNLGSSVGVRKVKQADALLDAVRYALQFDTKAIVEEAIEGQEIECSVLGNENPEASVCGEIVPNHDFYSYDAKYIDENGATLNIPASIHETAQDEIRAMAIRAYEVLECAGMARVDVFLQANGNIFINEINTLPGFTNISMYPKLWEASGLPYTQLLDRLIALAIQKHQQCATLRRDGAF